MRKLYLTSMSLSKLKDVLPDSPSNLKLAFIATAADLYEDKWFVDKDREIFKEMGFIVVEVDIKNKTEYQLRQEFNGCDVVYVSGGNSFYLLEKIRESGFDKVIDELLNKGVVYAGASAGAVVMGSDMQPIASLDDPSKAPNLKSTKGLGYVDFTILPHYGKEKYESRYKELKEKYGDTYKFTPLTDNQAIIVEGDNFRIVDCE